MFYHCILLLERKEFLEILLWCSVCHYCRLQCPVVLVVLMLAYVPEWHLAPCSACISFSLFLLVHCDLLPLCTFFKDFLFLFCTGSSPLDDFALSSSVLFLGILIYFAQHHPALLGHCSLPILLLEPSPPPQTKLLTSNYSSLTTATPSPLVNRTSCLHAA